MPLKAITELPEPVNDHDFELLSAYLDDELSYEERAVLEQRLQNEADLRHELELLRATVSLIGSLSLLKAPRDFTLKTPPKIANPRISVFPSLVSFASAAAAILLFVAGISILNTGSTLPPSTNAAMMRDIAALPTATTVPMTTFALTETPPPLLLQVVEGVTETSEAQLQPESALPAPSEELAAGGAPAAAIVAPTESETVDGEMSNGFAVGSIAQENMDTSAGAAASESSGLTASTIDDKTLTPATVDQLGFFAEATQLAPPTASPMPTRGNTPEPPTEIAQNETVIQETSPSDIQESQMAEADNTQRSIAQAEDPNSTLGIVLLVGGALLMLLAVGLFIRSRRRPNP